MKVNHVLLISLLIVGALLVPAVSATEIINTTIVEYTDTSDAGKLTYGTGSKAEAIDSTGFYINDVSLFDEISYFTLKASGTQGFWVDGELIPQGRHETTYTYNGVTQPAVVYVTRNTSLLGEVISTEFIFFPQNWDRQQKTGFQVITTPVVFIRPGQFYHNWTTGSTSCNIGLTNSAGEVFWPAERSSEGAMKVQVSHATAIAWKNMLVVENTDDEIKGYGIALTRTVKGISAYSTMKIFNDDTLVYYNASLSDISIWYPQNDINKIIVTSPVSDHPYILNPEIPDDPTDPTPTPTEEPTVVRKGTVTMTDNNGTTIRGFEVTAENAYTGQSYTVATETDVAVMTLPMDRTIEIRNPQTGVYETALIGYYRFYGQSSGYKMLVEDGIQVSVMPEKYGSYQLCDIRVTPESGYLTGTHQFQIRSRSDNSILQSGTISAKSATTDEWFNTTVSGGIASLILPYDTSNVQSQYAGNYYVYATSPGYEDSDYGTQIVVMPRTVSEIRDILLTPIGGIPTPGNVTLRIQTFSETGSGVVNAEIFVAGVLGEGASVWDTYTASSTGYLTVSVPGNSTYDIVARGAGYYDSARRVEVFTEDPPLIEIKLYLSGAPTLEPTTHPTGWPTDHPTTQPTGGIPDEDDDSEGFLMQAVRGIGLAFGVGFATAKLIFGMLLALSIGYATAKQLRGGAAEFGLGLLGGTLLGVLIGLLPVWIIVVLLLIVGLYIGNRYVGGGNHG